MYIALFFLLSITCYIVPHLLHIVLKENDIKSKYCGRQGTGWALVTGASSGIGKSIVLKLASKGINVVLVAKNDGLLGDLKAQLTMKYPAQQFRIVEVDLCITGEGYMRDIAAATEDLQITMLFNIAGYLFFNNFAKASVEDKLANVECNVTSVVRITDHFYKKMVSNGTPGAIAFASSSTSFCATPYGSIYSSGKAFLSSFAHSLAIEAKEYGVDIFVVHPGAVNTAFYEKFPNFTLFKLLRFIGQTPEDVADIIINNLGRTISLDSGLFAFITKLADKVLGPNAVIPVLRFLLRFFPDMKQAFQVKSENKKD